MKTIGLYALIAIPSTIFFALTLKEGFSIGEVFILGILFSYVMYRLIKEDLEK